MQEMPFIGEDIYSLEVCIPSKCDHSTTLPQQDPTQKNARKSDHC